MGNHESHEFSVTTYDPKEWKVIGTYKLDSEIVQSSKGMAEKRILYLDPTSNLDKEIEIYQYRKNQNTALVKCIAVHPQNTESKKICGHSQLLTVLTQLIPLRLSQLPQLTFAESIYLLSESLRGYKDCYNKLGPFEVTEQMIGINNDGQVRVWVNPDFAQNHPVTEKPLLHTSGTFKFQDQRTESLVVRRDQNQMLKTLIGLIEKKCESGHFPSDFSQRIMQNSIHFDQAFDKIESYVVEKNLFIPNRILNMNTTYPKGKYFTPGQQYLRDENDPLWRSRRPFLPQPKDSKIQFFQIQPQNSDLQHNQVKSSKDSIQKVSKNSPILSLYQYESPKNIEQGQKSLQSPRTQVFNINKKVTFNLISPEVSTLVFNNQSCIYPHQILQKR